MYPKFMEVDDENINDSVAQVDIFEADMGGTELLEAISYTIWG